MDILSDWPLYSMCSLNLANRSLYLKEYQENKDIRYLLLEYFKMKKYWKQCLLCYINQTIWVCFPYWLMSSIYIKKEGKHARLNNSQKCNNVLKKIPQVLVVKYKMVQIRLYKANKANWLTLNKHCNKSIITGLSGKHLEESELMIKSLNVSK